MTPDLQHSAAAVTVQVISTQPVTVPRHVNDVDFNVKYPEGYAGQKIMPEGITVISKELADQLTKMGIGEIVPNGPTVESTEREENIDLKDKGDGKTKSSKQKKQ